MTAAVAVMSVVGFAFIIDHIWLIDQRDVLKGAADAAAIAATHEMDRRIAADSDITPTDLYAAVNLVAWNYAKLNFAWMSEDRLDRAKETLRVDASPQRVQGTVDVVLTADLGGTLFSRHLPAVSNYKGPEKIHNRARVETRVRPIEAVLAIDISYSMQDKLEGGLPDEDTDEKSRMVIIKDAAKALVNILRPNTHNRVAIGVVPWHLTVRLADTTATTWSTRRWARYPTERTYGMPYECTTSLSSCTPDAVAAELPASAPEDWNGCLDGHRMGGSGTSAAAAGVADLFTTPSASPFSQAYYPAFYGVQYECVIAFEDDLSDLPSDYHRHQCYNPYDA
ncbi:MAG: hypothetical protein OXN81_19760, partial [Alphaproteobacteria bacterium]|nr:hypothetical protein [Alphaproteobacteria bacterium]